MIPLTLLLLLSLPSEIAIRHDKKDADYRALGEKYPSVVRVGKGGGAGTLIAPDWVLTAAHVASGMVRRTRGDFRVFVDGHEEGYAVRQVIIHPRFTDMGPHDLALIRLEKPLEGISPSGLYRKDDEAGKKITLVGHGDMKKGTGGEWIVDGNKRGATNLIDEVNDEYIMFDFDAPEEATELEGTSGPGDSGGPAFIETDGNAYVAGVSSLGMPGKNGPGTYGAREHYVRVSRYVRWIDKVMSNPPGDRFVNLPKEQERRGGPGRIPPGVHVLSGIGLLFKDVEGNIQMVGRIDQRYPKALLDGGIRPPAKIVRLNGQSLKTAKELLAFYNDITPGESFQLEFLHQGKTLTFDLIK